MNKNYPLCGCGSDPVVLEKLEQEVNELSDTWLDSYSLFLVINLNFVLLTFINSW